MVHVLLVAAGGALGACARFGVSRLFGADDRTFLPLPTLLVNVLGCFAIGWLMAHWSSDGSDATGVWRHLLVVGFLGAFTTFSAFGLESVQMLQRGAMAGMLVNIALQVGLGLAAVWAGMLLAR